VAEAWGQLGNAEEGERLPFEAVTRALLKFFDFLLISFLFGPNKLRSTLFSTPLAYFPPFMTDTKFHSHVEPQAKLQFCAF
jgi:hypothetical protein